MNLSTGTSSVLRDGKRRRGSTWTQEFTTQGSLWQSRWERIGLAAQKKDRVFSNLLTHINVETLSQAFDAIDGKKALGTDAVDKSEYGKNLLGNLEDLVRRIHVGSYKPQLKREVLIPKSNGKMRPIAIACFEDKLVDWVVSKILTLIYEPLFIRNSFGFRPNKSAHDAIRATYMSLKDDKRPFVVEIDFANCFNTIPHKGVMKSLSKRISDGRFKGLIGRFLKGGILNHLGKTDTVSVGTPQGGIMSPILANIYLHEAIDEWFIENFSSYNNVIVRYADDAIFLNGKVEQAQNLLTELQKRVVRFGLVLNMDKTRMVDFRRSENNDFSFLGFTFYWGEKKKFRSRPLKIKTEKKRLHKQMQDFDTWIKGHRSKASTSELWNTVKAKLIGHYNYFGLWTNYQKLLHFYSQAVYSVFKWLNRRSQKRSFSWEQFKRKLELNPLPTPPLTQELKCFTRSIYA